MGVFTGVRRVVAATARRVARLTEADAGGGDAAGETIGGEHGWSRISGRLGQRDLTPLAQHRMQELAAFVWEANPLANRLIELPVAFLIGEGVRLEAADEEAQSWLDQFWADPINNLDINLASHMRELALFGEQLWPVLPAGHDGRVRLGKIDPGRIANVITDPDNDAVVIGVETRAPDGDGVLRRWRVLYDAPDVELFGPRAQGLRAEMDAGECFYWRVNHLSSGRRGRSDILPALDHVDAHEQLLFGEVERAQAIRSINWDVELVGATPEQVAERARTIAPPEPLSVRVHNEAEKWTLQTPQLNSADAAEATRLVRNHVLGGSTIPEFWMADGGNVNLATASSMGEPTYKVFLLRQRLWRSILEAVGRYVIRRRLLAVGLPQLAAEEGWRPHVVFPELTAKDVARFSTVFQQVVAGAVQALQSGVMSEASAVRLVVLAAAALGLEVDALEELEAARVDASRRAELDIFRDPPPPNPFSPPGAAAPTFPEDGAAPREP